MAEPYMSPFEGSAKRGFSDIEFLKRFGSVKPQIKVNELKNLEQMETRRRMAERLRGSVGAVDAGMLGKATGIVGAGQAGWGVGRMLGNSPLLTDPNMTYDQFYQNMLGNLFRRTNVPS